MNFAALAHTEAFRPPHKTSENYESCNDPISWNPTCYAERPNKPSQILPRDEIGAITVGVFQDSLSLAMCSLSALMTATFLMMNRGVLSKEPRLERTFASLAISTAGVALAWNSLTPWLALGGMMLTIWGGFIFLGSRWDSNEEAGNAARFIWERALGFLLAFIGACILAASRSALLLNQSSVWATQSDHVQSTWIGSVLLVAGLFIQLQPFPFLGWAVSKTELYSPAKTLLNLIFPAWAAFPLLVRLEPQFRNLGLFPHFGWIALASSILAVLSGLFKNHWRRGLSAWLVAGLSLSSALLAFSGPLAAISLMIGLSLGAMCLSGSATALANGDSE